MAMYPLPYPLTDYANHAYAEKLTWRYGTHLTEFSIPEAEYELLKLAQQLPADHGLARIIEAIAYWIFLNHQPLAPPTNPTPADL